MIDTVIVHCDGGCQSKGTRTYGSFKVYAEYANGTRRMVKHDAYHEFGKGTVNTAEYMALIIALEYLQRQSERGVTWNELHVYSDSQLMVRQVDGTFGVHAIHLIPYYMKARNLLLILNGKIHWTPRETNVRELGH